MTIMDERSRARMPRESPLYRGASRAWKAARGSVRQAVHLIAATPVVMAHGAAAGAGHWLATPVHPVTITPEPDDVTTWLIRETERRADIQLHRPA